MGSKNKKKKSRKSKELAASDPMKTPSKPPSKDQTSSQNDQETQSSSSGPNSFHSIQPPLSDGVLKFVESRGFHSMTPVQAATMPLFLTNKDVAVQAVTGSGKTLAFLIPIVEMILRNSSLLKKHQIGSLVLSPTRELAQQTYAVAQELLEYVSLPPPLLLVGGGSSYRPVAEDLRNFAKLGSDVVIGTPGRTEDILTRYDVMDVKELECLVLDEADVLLEMGFDQTLNTILNKLPKMRRTGLFSATGTGGGGTRSRGMKELMARAGMRNPVWVNVAIASSSSNKTTNEETISKQATPSSLSNYYVVTPLDEKLSRLVSFLSTHQDEKIICFFVTCACVEFYGTALQKLLPKIELLHGKMVQKRREKAMERFRTSESKVLLCTDVAARGLDVNDVNWVVQFDAPQDPASFVHRVGRSARAGKVGSSLLFIDEREESYIDLLKNRKVPLSPLRDTEACAPPSSSGEDDTVHDSKQHGGGAESTVSEGRIIRSATGGTIPDVLPEILEMVRTDRDMLEKGTKAFTSYIRAYKEHVCSFIFRFASLDLGLLATSFCLLRLPKMPELRDKKFPSFRPSLDVDIYAIPFLDKQREEARQTRLKAELAAGGKNAKQIKAEQRQAERLRRQKEKRQEERAKGRNPNKKRGRQQQLFDEWDDLAKEERLYKKLRRKKITKEQYDKLMYGESKVTDSATERAASLSSSDSDDE